MFPQESSGKTSRGRPPVIVVGAHRSGTTATAQALELMGLQIGQRLDSHCEPRGLRTLHDDYLRRCGASWYDPAPFLESLRTPQGERACFEYLRENLGGNFGRLFGYRKNPKGLWLRMRMRSGAVAWGWKEPRTTLFSPAWLKLFPEARVLFIVRHPLAAAASIRQRELNFRAGGDPANGHLDDLETCLRLVLLYIDAGERLASLARNYQRVRFEEIQSNPRESLQTIAEFCELRVTAERLSRAAASIRQKISSPWEKVTEETARAIRARYPILAQFGYDKSEL